MNALLQKIWRNSAAPAALLLPIVPLSAYAIARGFDPKTGAVR